jgi:hypothetical protein
MRFLPACRALLPLVPLAGLAAAQDEVRARPTRVPLWQPYLKPFRTPKTNLQPPLAFYDEVREMDRLQRDPTTCRNAVDAEGRPTCDNPKWQEHRQQALSKGQRLGGYLATVLQDSGSAADRRLAFYGSYFVDSIQDTIAIMSMIPGEPEAATRDENYGRAIDFLRVHLTKSRDGEAAARDPSPADYARDAVVGNKVYERPDAPLYSLDLNPFCALAEIGEPRDQAQALWFINEVVGIRKEFGQHALSLMKDFLLPLLAHRHEELGKQARAFLQAVDSKGRKAPEGAGERELGAWLDAVVYDVFPPIRQVSAGLVELHASDDLRRIGEVGRDALARDALGSTRTGRVGQMPYRGFRVMRLPAPLELLRIPVDAVITHVNGVPVATSAELLDAVTLFAKDRRKLIVEFVHEGGTKAIEYRFVD